MKRTHASLGRCALTCVMVSSSITDMHHLSAGRVYSTTKHACVNSNPPCAISHIKSCHLLVLAVSLIIFALIFAFIPQARTFMSYYIEVMIALYLIPVGRNMFLVFHH